MATGNSKIETLQLEKQQLEEQIKAFADQLAELSDEAKENKKQEIRDLEKQREEKLAELIAAIQDEFTTIQEETKKAALNELLEKYEREEWENMSYYTNVLAIIQQDSSTSGSTLLAEIQIKSVPQVEHSEVIDTRSIVSTPELLRGTETERRLLNVFKAPEFAKYGDTPEKRLETVFGKVHTTIEKFLLSKFAIDTSKEPLPPMLSNVLTPAIEWYLMDFLKQNQHDNNVADFTLANGISFDTFKDLFTSVSSFAGKATATYGKGKALLKAIDFLSIHKEVLTKANKSDILSNPLKCKEFLENPLWSTEQDVYSISLADAGITFGNEQPIGLSEAEKQEVKALIGEIEVVESPETTKLLLGLVEKADPFFDKTAVLANEAMNLMDQAEGSLGMFKSLGIDIFKEINSSKFLKGVLDFVLSILGFTGGFEGLQKRRYSRRIDKQLDEQKRGQISAMFQEYLEKTNTPPIAEENKLTTLLKNKVKFPTNSSLFDIDGNAFIASINEKITDVSSLNPAVIKAVVGGTYITTTTEDVEQTKNGKTKTVKVKKEIVNADKFTQNKDKIIPKYVEYMTKQLVANPDYLQSVGDADTVAFTMISSLFIQPDHVIDGIKAKVFLPTSFIEGDYQPRIETSSVAASETPASFVDNFTEADKAILIKELQAKTSPLTAEMIVKSAGTYGIPVVYLAGVIKNDSSYGTAGVGARTHNPGNVGNTGSSERNFSSRQEGLDAAAKVIKERIDAYKAAYPAETGIPPIKNLLENRGPDGKGFLPHQANYQKENPYRADNAPLGAYMTAQNGPEAVHTIVENLNAQFLA